MGIPWPSRNGGTGVLVLCLLATGCGGPRFYPVAGRVTLDGTAVAGAAVMFHPVAGGPVASGVTNDEGQFQLETMNRAGVPAGEYVVTVTKQRTAGVRADETVEHGGMRVEWLVPERYSNLKTSGLKATVPAPRYEFHLSQSNSGSASGSPPRPHN